MIRVDIEIDGQVGRSYACMSYRCLCASPAAKAVHRIGERDRGQDRYDDALASKAFARDVVLVDEATTIPLEREKSLAPESG